jgi:DNA-binding NarL/FixJ family response regulator
MRRVEQFTLGEVRLVVVSAPLAGSHDALSPAELEVALLIARGMSNAEIARSRGTSVRTVANQVRSIFMRLDVDCRRKVAAALIAGEGPDVCEPA